MGLQNHRETSFTRSLFYYLPCGPYVYTDGSYSKETFFSFLYFPLKQTGYDFGFYSFQYLVLFIFINLLMTPDLHPTHYTPGAGNLALDL